ncbi:MAG TPA: protease modulator HflK [Myxococcota bacterium]|nr:protease modulator HflK [Myxococcota bacterium]
MRQTRNTSSELRRMLGPLARLLDAAWRRMHWWVAAMALLYAGSGITVIQPDEVAVIARWGRLVGDTPATQEHGPGLLFALPRPIDEVVRVKTRHVWQLEIHSLGESTDRYGGYPLGDTLDPLTVGYALTGDQNIVHVSMMGRYRVRDPADFAFYGPPAEEILRVEVAAAMVRSLGEMGVDPVLSDRRKELIATATRRVQEGLDAAHSGLALVSLELTDLRPPRALAGDFDAVQSAYIQMETRKKEAEAYAQGIVPRAHAEADASVQAARADAAAAAARARGDADAFRALEREFRANPVVVHERLYRDAVGKAIGAAQNVRWVPPPAGRPDERMRLQVEVEKAGPGEITPTLREE